MPGRLLPQQGVFVTEYMLDFDPGRAALAAGYRSKGMGTRLLGNPAIIEAIDAEAAARKDRLRVDADRLTEEYAKIAFANARDYVPRLGAVLDLHRLDRDKTAAIEEINFDERIDPVDGAVTRRTRIKMHDKIAALTNLAKSVGMLTERHVHEHSLEVKVLNMTPQERQELARQLRLEGERLLPAYEAAVAAGEIVEEDEASE